MKNYNPMVLHVKTDSVRDMYQTGIGAHVSQCKSIASFRTVDHWLSSVQYLATLLNNFLDTPRSSLRGEPWV